MEANGFSKVTKNLGGMISKNSPTILTGLAVGGLFTTVVFAVRATPKAQLLLNEELEERGLSSVSYDSVNRFTDSFTKLEIIKIAWKPYIPAVSMGIVTIACVIGSNSINQRRNAALATVYGLTEAAFREYKEKIVETIGKGKELKVREEIDAEHIKQNPAGKNEIIITGKGEVLCYDSLSGRYFKSDIEQIRKTVNALNKELLSNMFLTINEFYSAVGLAGTKLGDEMGWDLDKGLLEVSFSSQLTEDGEPCLVLDYAVTPKFYN